MKWKDGDRVVVQSKYSHKPNVAGKVIETNKERDEVLVEFIDGVRNWFVPDWLEEAPAEAETAEKKAKGTSP